MVKVVLLHAERSRHEGAVISDKHNLTSFRVLRSLHEAFPCNHPDIVGSGDSARLGFRQRVVLAAQNKFFRPKHVHWNVAAASTSQVLAPFQYHRLLDQSKEVVNVRGSDRPSDGTLLLKSARHRIWLEEAGFFRAVLAKHAELSCLPGQRVKVLAVNIDFEPLARHRRCHDPHRHLDR